MPRLLPACRGRDRSRGSGWSSLRWARRRSADDAWPRGDAAWWGRRSRWRPTSHTPSSMATLSSSARWCVSSSGRAAPQVRARFPSPLPRPMLSYLAPWRASSWPSRHRTPPTGPRVAGRGGRLERQRLATTRRLPRVRPECSPLAHCSPCAGGAGAACQGVAGRRGVVGNKRGAGGRQVWRGRRRAAEEEEQEGTRGKARAPSGGAMPATPKCSPRWTS